MFAGQMLAGIELSHKHIGMSSCNTHTHPFISTQQQFPRSLNLRLPGCVDEENLIAGF